MNVTGDRRRNRRALKGLMYLRIRILDVARESGNETETETVLKHDRLQNRYLTDGRSLSRLGQMLAFVRSIGKSRTRQEGEERPLLG